MARKNFGDVHGNRKIPSARRPRTRERVADAMEPTSGQLTTSLWTQISSTHAVKRLVRRTKAIMKPLGNFELLRTLEIKWWEERRDLNVPLKFFFSFLGQFRSITITRIFLNRSASTQTMATRNGSKSFKNAFNHWSHEVELYGAQEVLPRERCE